MDHSSETAPPVGARYALSDQLGEGGMGAVFRATDRLTGHTVALKRVTAKAENLTFNSASESTNYRLALAREFKVLASLRHPHIINVLDYGFDDEGMPFVTMELLEDADTFLAVGRAAGSLERQANLLIELLQALAYLHRRGILHRDLKPGNVLVTADKSVKVLDFGLAVGRDEAMEAAGTLAYMAPEILQQQPATIESDLYAVGVMAYELFAGKHPFNTQNIQHLLTDILSTEPDLTPLEHRARETMEIPAIEMEDRMRKAGLEIPEEALGQTVIGGVLDDIDRTQSIDDKPDIAATEIDPERVAPSVSNLPTEIDPDAIVEQAAALQTEVDHGDRTEPHSADDALKTAPVDSLENPPKTGIEASGFSAKVDTQDLPAAAPATLAGIVGKLMSKAPESRYRDAYSVINDLCVALGMSAPEESPAIRESYLQAAAFVGRDSELKSLSDALAETLDGRGGSWLISGESGVGKSRLMDELRIQALARGATVLRGQAVSDGGLSYQVLREPLRRLTLSTPLDDVDAAALYDLAPDIGQLLGREIPQAPVLEGEAYHQRLQGAIVAMFQKQDNPLLLLLEDLQWADESVAVLNALSAVVTNAPVMIVGNFRKEERPDLPDELPDVRVMTLDRLNEESVADLTFSMLGEAGRQSDVLDLLQRETEGNVFFLVEVVRALAEEAGRLGEIGRMSLPEFVTTGGVSAVIERRLARVPSGGRDLLRLAAVAGRELDLAILDTLRNTVDLEDWLTACANSAVLESQDGRWRFAHDKLREATLGAMKENEISVAHRRVAEGIETAYPDAPEQAAILAHHWRRAGNARKEFSYVKSAGDYDLHTSAFADARSHFERALDLAPQVADADTEHEQFEIQLKLGDILQNLGNYPEAIDFLDRSLTYFRNVGAAAGIARALNLKGDVLWRRAEFPQAITACEESLAIYREQGDALGIARTLNRIGMAIVQQGDHGAATPYLEESLDYAHQSGDPNVTASVVNNLGVSAFAQGQYDRAGAYFQEGLDLARAVGNRQRAATLLSNLGSIYGTMEDFDRATTCFEESLALCRTIGEKRGVAQALDNLGALAEMLEDFDRARHYLEESLTLARQVGAADRTASALYNLGEVARKTGDLREADGRYQEALQIADDSGNLPYILDAVLGLAQIADDPARRVEWLSLVLNHPAAYDFARESAQEALSALENEIDSKAFEAAKLAGASLELDDVVASILSTNTGAS